MSKTPTIYQKLTKAMFGGGVQLNNSDMNQSKSITVNSYHMILILMILYSEQKIKKNTNNNYYKRNNRNC